MASMCSNYRRICMKILELPDKLDCEVDKKRTSKICVEVFANGVDSGAAGYYEDKLSVYVPIYIFSYTLWFLQNLLIWHKEIALSGSFLEDLVESNIRIMV